MKKRFLTLMAFAATSLFAFAQDYTQYVDPLLEQAGTDMCSLELMFHLVTFRLVLHRRSRAGTGVLVIITAIQQSSDSDRCT